MRRLPVLLSAALGLILIGLAPARAADFVDAAGRRVVLPPSIQRVLPAERNAEVLVYVLAPDKLAGVERGSMRRGPGRVPTLTWRPRSTPATMAQAALRLRPQVIVDAGPVTPESAAFADQVQQMTGVPYILVDDSFARTPMILRSIGKLLGAENRAEDLAIFAEHSIQSLHGRLLIQPANQRPRVYYARGADGLSTALPGSPAGAAIGEAGAINVAYQLGRGGEVRVSPEQLYAWNPTIILAEGRRAYDSLLRHAGMRRLAAVRSKRVYLIPSSPFGWIEDPSGVNRLIGLYWLSSMLYTDATQEDLRTTACDFYDKFYRIQLTNAQLEGMLRPAGVAPPQAMQTVGEPLIGLGAAPPSLLPSGTPGASRGGGAAQMPAPAPATGVGSMMGPVMSKAPGQSCVVPKGPNPIPLDSLPGLGTNPAAPGNATPGGATPGATPPGTGIPGTGAPGVPPPGRRGRPAAALQAPPTGALPALEEKSGTTLEAPRAEATSAELRSAGMATGLPAPPAAGPAPLQLTAPRP